MFTIIFVVFIVLHGFVHLLYFGQSARYFELKPGMVWPDGSWAASRLVGDQASRKLASIALIIASIGFAVSGIGILMSQAWWQPTIVAATAFSSVVYFIFWNGKTQNLDGQGIVGVLLNIAILAAVIV